MHTGILVDITRVLRRLRWSSLRSLQLSKYYNYSANAMQIPTNITTQSQHSVKQQLNFLENRQRACPIIITSLPAKTRDVNATT